MRRVARSSILISVLAMSTITLMAQTKPRARDLGVPLEAKLDR